MPLDHASARILRNWLAMQGVDEGFTHERRLLEEIRAATNTDARAQDLAVLSKLCTNRIERLERVLKVVARHLLASEDGEPSVPRGGAGGLTGASPYREPSHPAPPPGSFACRTCGRVLPNSEACQSADGRFCVECFAP